MITLSNYLVKRGKWPYKNWHKRYFYLENGFLTYGKSEQEVVVDIVCHAMTLNSLLFR
jgi:hypothetical protein